LIENKVTLQHEFERSEADPVICKHCGLSQHAVIHPVAKVQSYSQSFALPPNIDGVDAPAHYCLHKVTTVMLIEDWNLDFFLGSTLKYIERYQLKGSPLQDLKKARKYLDMKIELLETGELKETIQHG